jgi:AcrR family transcriptional regulator
MPKIVDREKQRAEILAGAFPLFATKGFGVVGMRQCAKELGVSTGTLYHYFSSKESLFEQMFLRKSQGLIQELVAAIPTGKNRKTRITALIGFVEEHSLDLQRMLAMAFDFRRNGPEASELLNQSFVFFRMSLEQTLGISKGKGADQLLVLVFGILSRKLLLKEPLDLEAYRDQLERILPPD